MQHKYYVSIYIFLILLLSSSLYGQNVVQLVPFNGQPQTELIAQIKADTTATGGLLANRVYELTSGTYICQETFYVEDNQTLRLRAAGDVKPIVYLFPTGTGSNPQRPPGYFVRLRGGDVEMSGIALSGYFEPIDSNFNNVQGGIFRNDNEGSNYYIDNCVFSNINGQIIRCEGSTGTIKVTNSVFTNLGALSTSNFGAGKGIDLRASSCDSLILVNNTFTNYQDRVVRHYNFGDPLAGTGNIEYTRIDHNTFFNGMGFHGLLSLGNVGSKVQITNNLFKDAFAAGEDPTDSTRAAEWANTGEKYPDGENRIMWIFTAPNNTTSWTVKNNFWAVSSAGQTFFNEHTAEPITAGSPLSWHINSRLGADSVNAFTKIDDPQLANTQSLMLNLMRWYVSPSGGNKTKNTPTTLWNKATDDMDRKPLAFWIDDLDVSYSTSSPAYTGAENGFPAGNLNAFPDKLNDWLNGGGNVDLEVVQLVPFNGQPQTELIAQIKADTTATGGLLANRVYELTSGTYICQETFYVEDNQTLRLRAAGDVKPIVYLFPTGTGSNPQRPPGYFVRLRGGDVEMSGIALSGYFEPIDSNFNNVQGGIFRNDNEGSNYYIDNCVFSNINGQIIRCEGSTGTIKVTNSVFTNLGALSTSNFGAGKGIDLRASSCDSLILVNNTFTNYQDRVVRHYNFGDPLAGTGNIEYTRIDHNTFFNGMGFHGLLSLGNVGSKVQITNNLFKDAFAAGEDPTDSTRAAEWANTGEKYPDGENRIMWIFTAPNNTTSWTVKNNFWAVSSAGQTFFNEHTAEPITAGSPLSWHINSRLGADSVNAFTKIDDPQLANTQSLMLNLMRWYVSPSGGNKTKNTPTTLWNKATDDMDRKPLAFWIDDLDVSYSTSSPAYTGAENGFPAGNLNAFPDKLNDWLTDVDDVSDNKLPDEYSLNQNYPNPFNPSTIISMQFRQQANVTVKVYDILGSEVATLVNNEVQNVGKYEVNFNAIKLVKWNLFLYSKCR